MIHSFAGENADVVWKSALAALIESGMEQSSRLGITKEILHANFKIENPRNRWVFSRKPGINPAFAIVEVFWILSGRDDAKIVNHWNPALPKFSGYDENYHGAYGYRLRKKFGFDQIDRAYQALQSNPDSRQIVLQLLNPAWDMPSDDGMPVSTDIPCNICSMPKIRDGRLEWLQILRSNDIIRGLPYNIVQFTTIQEVLSGWLNIEVGAYHQVSDSLHFYDEDLRTFSSLSDIHFVNNEDVLALPKKQFDEALDIIISLLDGLSNPSISKEEFISLFQIKNLPRAYQNLVSIAAADSARRRGWIGEKDEAINSCTNKALLFAWKNWEIHVDSRLTKMEKNSWHSGVEKP